MDRAAQADPEPDGIGCVADADLFLKTGAEVHQRDSAVEHDIDGFAETWFCVAEHSQKTFSDE
jgi:hypothetical protein